MGAETEATSQLQAMGFKWSEAWTHWHLNHNGTAFFVYTPMPGWWATCMRIETPGGNQSPIGVHHPLDVVEWVQREMDANG